MADLTPLERAGRVRAVASYWEADELMGLLPPGSLILTPDEAEKVLCALAVPWRKRTDEARALLAGKEQT